MRKLVVAVVFTLCFGCSDTNGPGPNQMTDPNTLPQIPAPVTDTSINQNDTPDVSLTEEQAGETDVTMTDTMGPDTVSLDAGEDEVPDSNVPDTSTENDSEATADLADSFNDTSEFEDSIDEDGASDTMDPVKPGDTPEPVTAKSCFAEITEPGKKGPDYDQFENIVIGSHCNGTNHQDIHGVEKVVIIGDSITQGSPNDIHPTCLDTAHFYRNKLAEWLADEFNLDTGNVLDWATWKTFNCSYDGSSAKTHSGDFSNCSKWGAKTDDFMEGGSQLDKCFGQFPEFGSDKKTLIFFTIGGNDVGSINKAGFEAPQEEVDAGYPKAWALANSTITYLEETIAWLTNPLHFPNGSYVVFGTPYEFTDSTGNTEACDPEELEVPIIGGTINIKDLGIDLQEIAGFGPWQNQEEQFAIVTYLLEEYVRIAVQYQVDVVFLAEAFCGHGWVATGEKADEDNICYKGPDAELWFDKSCYHPSDAGHQAIYTLFQSVIYQ